MWLERQHGVAPGNHLTVAHVNAIEFTHRHAARARLDIAQGCHAHRVSKPSDSGLRRQPLGVRDPLERLLQREQAFRIRISHVELADPRPSQRRAISVAEVAISERTYVPDEHSITNSRSAPVAAPLFEAVDRHLALGHFEDLPRPRQLVRALPAIFTAE